MKRIEIFDGFWNLNDIKKSPDKIFVFGDNNARVGKGGQAIIRDLPNSIGIRTKKGPSSKSVAYYTDLEYEINCLNILEDILKIKSLHLNGKTIVFSKGGYGTGLASLKEKAPKTYHFLVDSLRNHFEFDNNTGTFYKVIPSFDQINSANYLSLNKSNSEVLVPLNNTFFKSNFLENELNTFSDLIKSEFKTAFTSKTKYNTGDILNLNFLKKEYLMVKVCSSYPLNFISLDDWSLFEGLDTKFIKSVSIQDWYQTQFQFICVLDESGNMIFKDDLFSKELPEMKNSKNVGIPIITTYEKKEIKKSKSFFKKKTLQDLLIENNINGEVKIIPDLSKERYQVKVDDIYYAIQFNKGLLWNTIEIVITSKTPFI
jgi:hypothetical protein